MRKRIAIASLLSTVVLLAGCIRNVEGAPSVDPDSIVVFNNVDRHPNVVKLCIDGVAFATTTQTIQRVPEWDKNCSQTTHKGKVSK